ncbi:hypothetical protein [Novosphingobium rosa]|uniref:hypothetical protein n=1 Tax=Novosphingobium rosa TaxID=76978 RepID=UPI000833B382|nr:hypothetical protein [Novosphingobium rosa]
MDRYATQAERAAYQAGVKAGLDAAAKAITDIQYDGRNVHDHFAEGTNAAYEAVVDLKLTDIAKP